MRRFTSARSAREIISQQNLRVLSGRLDWGSPIGPPGENQWHYCDRTGKYEVHDNRHQDKCLPPNHNHNQHNQHDHDHDISSSSSSSSPYISPYAADYLSSSLRSLHTSTNSSGYLFPDRLDYLSNWEPESDSDSIRTLSQSRSATPLSCYSCVRPDSRAHSRTSSSSSSSSCASLATMATTVGPLSPSSSPRLPSPPPFPEVQIGLRSPTISAISNAASPGLPTQGTTSPDLIDTATRDAGATRRIRPGTKAADMASGPPLVPLAEVSPSALYSPNNH